MKVKLLFAVISACSGAGVIAWDVKKLMGEPPPVLATPGPAIAGLAVDLQNGGGGAVAPMASLLSSLAPSSTEPPETAESAPEQSTDQSPPPNAAGAAGSVDFNSLFQQMLKQRAEGGETAKKGKSKGAATDEAAATSTPTTTAATSGTSGSDPWSKLELRGLLVGEQRALALVNGHLLRVGDELPGTHYVIAEIRADRLIATDPGSVGPEAGKPRVLALAPVVSPAQTSPGSGGKEKSEGAKSGGSAGGSGSGGANSATGSAQPSSSTSSSTATAPGGGSS